MLYELKQKHPPEQDIVLPLKVTFGITVALCGGFLYMIPHPYTQSAAAFLVPWGTSLAVEGGLDEMERQGNN